jgi:hypothetical protein
VDRGGEGGIPVDVCVCVYGWCDILNEWSVCVLSCWRSSQAVVGDSSTRDAWCDYVVAIGGGGGVVWWWLSIVAGSD